MERITPYAEPTGKLPSIAPEYVTRMELYRLRALQELEANKLALR